MLILDKGYNETRNKFVKPLSDYSVQYRHLRNSNIRNILLTKTKNVEKLGNKEYKFYLNESDLLKGLLGDILLAFCGAQRPLMRFRMAALRGKTATHITQIIAG